jgi:hypothetical protein
MAEEKYRPSDSMPPRKNNRTVFIVILVLLIIASQVYVYIKFNQRTVENQQLMERVNADSIRIADLGLKYQEALANVEAYRGQNAQLDSIIAVKEKAILDLKNSYASLQKQMKLSEADYNKQVSELNGIINDLQNQIIQLQAENKILIEKNDSLGKSLANQITTTNQLTSANIALTKKVSQASLLKPSVIAATGARSKSSGKEDETNNAKKSERLKVCFDVPANPVADPGEKTFYIRIISPEGVTLAIQSSGSGALTKAENGESVPYTTSHTIDYDQQPTNTCAYWEQSAPYSAGTYTAEIYQDGYLIGTKKFELK